ncbi:MAG: RNA polymerase sigma factor [Dolichospermum sp. DET50]|nr:RNA polymerase sigma factor [Dolichospermum sp. DET66]MBS3032713.1 RNA polymerase sigma factor [Dolichospermum sp. DET67]MBS3037919.1 RNA polymerase sigma factor [Dolichospermum sp. DET50]QSX69842.1 MAG: RNA polymerase sigma factor [Dolichospermum sp. DET69]
MEYVTGNIKSFKAWLTQLTHNVCMDIHRKDDQRAKQVESWEFQEELVSHEETPILLTTQEELENFFEVVIDELPSRLRETFILHFKEQLSYQEIGEKLNISYDNVRKRISQARAILKQRYHQDFLGEENRYSTDLQSFRYQVASQSRTRKKSENMIKRKVDIDDTSVLSDQLEIVPIVEQEKSEPAVTVSPTVVADVQSNLNREVEEIEKTSDVNEEYLLRKVGDFWQCGNLQKIVQLNHKLNWGKSLVNSTRWALFSRLQETGLPVFTGSGGPTKFNRTRLKFPKTHWLDAACVGQIGELEILTNKPLLIKATGHGTRQMCRTDKFGFPSRYVPRIKFVKGFQTGDIVKAIVTTGKKIGKYIGRVAVRATGSFNISASKLVQGIS